MEAPVSRPFPCLPSRSWCSCWACCPASRPRPSTPACVRRAGPGIRRAAGHRAADARRLYVLLCGHAAAAWHAVRLAGPAPRGADGPGLLRGRRAAGRRRAGLRLAAGGARVAGPVGRRRHRGGPGHRARLLRGRGGAPRHVLPDPGVQPVAGAGARRRLPGRTRAGAPCSCCWRYWPRPRWRCARCACPRPWLRNSASPCPGAAWPGTTAGCWATRASCRWAGLQPGLRRPGLPDRRRARLHHQRAGLAGNRLRLPVRAAGDRRHAGRAVRRAQGRQLERRARHRAGLSADGRQLRPTWPMWRRRAGPRCPGP